LPVGGWQELETAVHLGRIGTWFAGQARERPRTAARWHQRWPKGCGWWQRGRRGVRRVVHGVDLGHAAGEVAQEPGAHLSVHTLAGGEEPRHLVHALAEAGAVLAQHRGVCAQRGCRGRGTQRSAGSTGDRGGHPTGIMSCSPSKLGIRAGGATPLAACPVLLGARDPNKEYGPSTTQGTGNPRAPLHP